MTEVKRRDGTRFVCALPEEAGELLSLREYDIDGQRGLLIACLGGLWCIPHGGELKKVEP